MKREARREGERDVLKGTCRAVADERRERL